jgi:nicotinate-nucleotide pyrophosphorylase (carboxylating)
MDRDGLKRILNQALREDVGRGDLTLAFTQDKKVAAQIKVKQSGILAGCDEVLQLFKQHQIKCENHFKDGDKIKKNDVVFELNGLSHNILLLERTVLNILSVMSGIATVTQKFVDKAGKTKVAATRKTHPLLRLLEKKAVFIGGGLTHRMGLDDMVIIKDNHLKLFENITCAVDAAKEDPYHKIEVEVTSKEQAFEAAIAGADIIMLDNMTPAKIKGVIKLLEKEGVRGNVLLEASGGITLDNLKDYAKSGVDIISTSALTMAPGVDFSLKFL